MHVTYTLCYCRHCISVSTTFICTGEPDLSTSLHCTCHFVAVVWWSGTDPTASPVCLCFSCTGGRTSKIKEPTELFPSGVSERRTFSPLPSFRVTASNLDIASLWLYHWKLCSHGFLAIFLLCLCLSSHGLRHWIWAHSHLV